MLDFTVRQYRNFRSLSSSLQSLIINSAVVAFGSFMITPFLAVFLQNYLHMNTKIVGLYVAFSTLVQFGGGIPGALIAERMGLKNAMIFALSFRSIGFILLALSDTHTGFVPSAVFLIAAGSALYLPANRAYIVTSVDAGLRPLFLSISNSALNLGMAAGPLAASLMLDQNPRRLLFILAGLFVTLAAIHAKTLSREIEKPTPTSFRGLPRAIQSAGRPFVFSILTNYL